MLIGDYVLAGMIRTQAQGVKSSTSSKAALERITAGLFKEQRQLVDATERFCSVLCARRSGKSFALTSLALSACLKRPNSRCLIITPSITHARKNFWHGAPGGITDQLEKYGIGHRVHNVDMVVNFENKSYVRITGVHEMDDIEKLRGAPAENDIVIIDETQSFRPGVLDALLTRIIYPGMSSRKGSRLIVAGTPGMVAAGLFYDATCPQAKRNNHDQTQSYTCKDYGYQGDDRDKAVWVRFHWTLKDNTAMPHQWAQALEIKYLQNWSDDHPVWVREYLGEWVMDSSEMVFAYAGLRHEAGFVSWVGGPLAESEGPWHTIMGLDYGFEDDTAFVVLAYSQKLREVRVLYVEKTPHLTTDRVYERTLALMGIYAPQRIVVDTSHKNMSEELRQRFGLPVEYADKTHKNNMIELINSDFKSGRIKILIGSVLEEELLALTWDLSKGTKAELARRGSLHPAEGLPNHASDAFLYAWRYCYHHFLQVAAEEVKKPSVIEEIIAPNNRGGMELKVDEWYQTQNDLTSYYRSLDRNNN